MRTQISKLGNSLAVRIPATYAKDLNLEEGMAFDVSLVQGQGEVTEVLSQPLRLQFLTEDGQRADFERVSELRDKNCPIILTHCASWSPGRAVACPVGGTERAVC